MHLKLWLTLAVIFTASAVCAETDDNDFGFRITTELPTNQVITFLLEKQFQFNSKQEETNRRLLQLESQMSQIQKTLDKYWNISEENNQRIEQNQSRQIDQIQNKLEENIRQLKQEFTQNFEKNIVTEQKLNENQSRQIDEIQNRLKEHISDLEQKLLKNEQNISEIRKELIREKDLNKNLSQTLNPEKQKIIDLDNELNYRITASGPLPKDCLEAMERGNNNSGIYLIQPRSEKFLVKCDMNNTKGGGWTLFHNRFDGSQTFDLNWTDYKRGFGNLSGEFWLGLDHLHQLTENGNSELLVKLVNKDGKEAFAYYGSFGIGGEEEEYKLKLLEGYYGVAGDSLWLHKGMKFSTKDHWQPPNCVTIYGGGWWFIDNRADLYCLVSNLNGPYLSGNITGRATGINWYHFSTDHYSLVADKMMVRRKKT